MFFRESLLKNLYPHTPGGSEAAGRQSSPDSHAKANGTFSNKKGKRRARRR